MSGSTAHEFDWLRLDGDEEVAWSGRPKVTRAAVESLWVVVGGVGLGAMAVVVLSAPLIAGAALAGVVGVLGPVWIYLSVTNREYAVTNTAVYQRSGVASETVESAGMERVQNTSYHQSALGAVFDTGQVSIDTAGSAGTKISFKGIAEAREVQQELREIASNAADDGGQDTGADQEALRAAVQEARRLRETAREVDEALERRARAARQNQQRDQRDQTQAERRRQGQQSRSAGQGQGQGQGQGERRRRGHEDADR